MPSGEITLPGLAAAVGALLPENVIVVDESMTSGRGLMATTKGAPPHDWLGNTGGSIGIACRWRSAPPWLARTDVCCA
jgi:acetolactate synthase-1/2/3 large subunit